MQNLAKASLPPLLSVPAGDSVNFNWVPSRIPQGFTEVSSSRRQPPTIETPVESRLYSDGLFSFGEHQSRDGKQCRTNAAYRTSNSQYHGTRQRGDHHRRRITPQTAKRISDSIKFRAAQ